MSATLEEKESIASECQELTKKNSKLELSIRDIVEEQKGNKNTKVSGKFLNLQTISSSLFIICNI